jgi:hypothetical protein
VAVVAAGEASLQHARRLAEHTESVEVDVTEDESRRNGLAQTAAEWVVFLDEDDDPDDGMLDALVAAQAASGGDVVTGSVRPAGDSGAVHLFLGNPGALGLVENQYGVIGLVRATLAVSELGDDVAGDADWAFFARLALRGARIVSIPEPLSTHAGRPGKVSDLPGPGLAVLEAFEAPHAADRHDLPQLAATLAAALQREPDAPMSKAGAGLLRRAARKIAR